jgi:hypothetical protein
VSFAAVLLLVWRSLWHEITRNRPMARYGTNARRQRCEGVNARVHRGSVAVRPQEEAVECHLHCCNDASYRGTVNGESGLGLWPGKQWFNHRDPRAATSLLAQLAAAVTVSSADGTTDVALNAPVIITTRTGHLASVQVTPLTGASLTGSFNADGTQWTSATSSVPRSRISVHPIGCRSAVRLRASVSKPTTHAIRVTCEASEGGGVRPTARFLH